MSGRHIALGLAALASTVLACRSQVDVVHSTPVTTRADSAASTERESAAGTQPKKMLAARTYQNPVLPGTAPDPSACRVGDDYYLVTSSFEYFPGVPIYHSKDLVNWRQLGHVLTRESQLRLNGLESSKGVFAPTLRHHDGTFYMVTTNMDGGGSFYVTATDPAGPWSDPIWIRESVFTMDPSLFFDDDGKVYYTRHGEMRHGAVFQAELDVQTGELLEPPRRIWEGTGGIWPEGPHLYKVNGSYFLMISEGGTSYDHMVTVARSHSPWGPFEANPSNPILSHRELPKHPIQATGHADLLQTPEGNWWMVLLGIRPSTPRRHHIGRETFLAPVRWTEAGWPSVAEPLELEMSGDGLPPEHRWPPQPMRDEFSEPRLGHHWVHVRNPVPAHYSLTQRPGFLRLTGTTGSLDDVVPKTVLVQAQRHHRVRFRTELHFEPQVGQRAGLVVRGNEENHYQLLVESATISGTRKKVAVVVRRIAGQTQRSEPHALPKGPARLTIEGFADRYEFFIEDKDGQRLSLGRAPTTPFAYEQTQSFTGAFVGLYAHTDDAARPSVADFAWFEVQPGGGASR